MAPCNCPAQPDETVLMILKANKQAIAGNLRARREQENQRYRYGLPMSCPGVYIADSEIDDVIKALEAQYG